VTVYLDFDLEESSKDALPPPCLDTDRASGWALSDMVGTSRAQSSRAGAVYRRSCPRGRTVLPAGAAAGRACCFVEPAIDLFCEGDVVVVREDFADLCAGQRGAVVEVDTDGDARIRFEGREEDDLIFKMDFRRVVRDPLCRAPQLHVEDDAQEQQMWRRQRLTKDGAAELLEELRRLCDSSSLQHRVSKLARDVRWNRSLFLAGMRRVALELQAPVLQKWGFDVSGHGVAELQLAVQDHTFGLSGDAVLAAKARAVAKLLFGEMFDVLFPEAADDEAPAEAGIVVYGIG